MDLNVLNDGLIASKPWLNPVCNVISCNKIVTPVSVAPTNVFASGQVATNVLVNGVPRSNIMTTATIPNPNFNLATNVYTAPVAQYVSFSLSYSVQASNLAQNLGTSVYFRVNGLDQAVIGGVSRAFGANDTAGVSLNQVIRLNAGDTVGYFLTSSSTQAGSQIAFGNFSGIVVV
jgi:hypothetical protein